MMLELLLTFIDAPDFDSMLGEPLEDEWSLVLDSAKTVEHEDEKDVELMLHCRFFQILYCIAVLG